MALAYLRFELLKVEGEDNEQIRYLEWVIIKVEGGQT